MLAAEYTVMNKIDQISALLELMVLVRGREGDTENTGGTENSRCKVPEILALYLLLLKIMVPVERSLLQFYRV